MSFEGRDRRKHERMPIAMQVRYKSLDTFFYDYAMNISHGGIFIKTRRPLARGARVQVEFEVPGTPSKILAGGKVVRVILPGQDEHEPAGMGIEFEPISDKDRRMIDALWQANAGQPGKSEDGD